MNRHAARLAAAGLANNQLTTPQLSSCQLLLLHHHTTHDTPTHIAAAAYTVAEQTATPQLVDSARCRVQGTKVMTHHDVWGAALQQGGKTMH